MFINFRTISNCIVFKQMILVRGTSGWIFWARVCNAYFVSEGDQSSYVLNILNISCVSSITRCHVLALGKFQLNFIATKRTEITTSIDTIVAIFKLIPTTNRTKKIMIPRKLAEA
jgi:hypothetical protein